MLEVSKAVVLLTQFMGSLEPIFEECNLPQGEGVHHFVSLPDGRLAGEYEGSTSAVVREYIWMDGPAGWIGRCAEMRAAFRKIGSATSRICHDVAASGTPPGCKSRAGVP